MNSDAVRWCPLDSDRRTGNDDDDDDNDGYDIVGYGESANASSCVADDSSTGGSRSRQQRRQSSQQKQRNSWISNSGSGNSSSSSSGRPVSVGRGSKMCALRAISVMTTTTTTTITSDSVCKSFLCKFVSLWMVCGVMMSARLVNGDERMDRPSESGHFTATWAVHVPEGLEVANEIAAEHGFINLGKIVDDHYHFHHNTVSKRSLDPSHHHQGRLDGDGRVRWSKQQRAKSRQKRDYVRLRPSRMSPNAMPLNDPKWPQMWYLNRGNGLDMNVIPAWREGITGKGVVVTILDDGLESDHPDLEQNYDPKASYDVNSHDEDPMPHYDMTDSNRHGTRCAGEVAATANNSLCAVGIAYGASVGGVRMLDGDVTDAVEARSLSLNPQHIDIYSASWGPDDDGKTVDGPGEMATRAFLEGVTKGRHGKGSIFIWASGNGGREHDNCNCDGYTNSIWTLSISSATEEGHVPWYSEKCSSTLATTYSSGGTTEKQIVTTDLHHSCTASHTGTSASAPLAAGIVALVLEANANLTWRDLQHIVVRTAKPFNLKDPTWTQNGVNRRVSHSFGYGLMDAAAMVRLARTWKTVPEQQRCEINAPHLDTAIPAKSHKTLQLTVQHCKGVNYLEHVQAKITLQSQRRGDIEIYLKSPAGTKVTLLTSRTHDVSRSGFNQWPFMSVHTWGEAPHGSWQLEIRNEGRYMGHALLKGWSLIFYGTTLPIDKDDPISVRLVPNSSLNQNKYPVIILTKPSNNNNANGGGKNNRKQQQLQQQTQQQKQQSLPPFVLHPPPRKNVNKSPKNSTGKYPKNQRSTTPRPFAMSTSAFTDKNNRKYGLSALEASLKQNMSRPKLGNNNNNNNVDTTGDKYMYDKPPNKAPKQVKQENAPDAGGGGGYTQPPSTAASGSALALLPNMDYWTMATSNPNIPKLFQKYEKIQEVYPEFHPYVGPKNPTRSPYLAAVPISSHGKPSRENAKSLSFADLQQYSGVASKKSAASLPLSQQMANPNSRFLTAQSNGKSQITQWDILLYGTDEPPRANDPPRPAIDSTFGSEMVHNSLEFEAGAASGQWKDMQPIGESHSDVQRTAASNDQTGTACRSFAPNSKCIECIQNTFRYEGRCYTSCPERSFMLPEQSPAQMAGNPMRRRRRASLMRLLSVVPIERAIKMPAAAEAPAKLCAACHFSCLKCSGPNDYDCTACAPDSVYTERTANESYCSSPNDGVKSKMYDDHLYGVLLVLLPAMLILGIVLLISWLLRMKWCSHKSDGCGDGRSGYAYEKVEFDGSSEMVRLTQPQHEVTVDGSSSTCSSCESEDEPP